MDSAEQAILVSDFMLRLAPVVARRSLEYLFHPPAQTDDDEWHRHVADKNAMITLELASHLAARFAQYHDAAASPPEAKETAPAHKQSTGKPAKTIQSAASPIPKGTPPMSDLS